MIDLNDGRTRIVITGVSPEIDGGRFPVKRVTGDTVTVEADIFADGHDVISAVLLYREEGESGWNESPMIHLVNDRWQGSFTAGEPGSCRYTLSAWIDTFRTWRHNLSEKVKAGTAESLDFQEGAGIIEGSARNASGNERKELLDAAEFLTSDGEIPSRKLRKISGKRFESLMDACSERRFAVRYPAELPLTVDREKASFSTWYEMFPRSCSPEPGRHGTFRDCESRLPYIREMGFDVLYLPPIHPIGRTNRKGKNNSVTAGKGDPGTPWAIGAAEGGHKSVLPELGTLEDFDRLVKKAAGYDIEIALDIAFQCSPDHPYVAGHPEWFRKRPDGSIAYAENPPKKYQDIYPFDFQTEQWESLREELKSVFMFWIDHGIRIFRVDNPHTKPFAFWEWVISEIKKEYPEVIFLAEAFTRPKVMYRLAKLGFSQSYTYFTWRNEKWDISEYMKELTQTEVKEYFRPNFWPNTPDILSDYLRDGGKPAFVTRLILAATLSSSYGIYGPAYELCENRRKDRASEEYLNSEKYEIKHWNTDAEDSIAPVIKQVNGIRDSHPALRDNLSLHLHSVDNGNIICYSKRNERLDDTVLVVVNLDYHGTQSGWTDLDLEKLGLDDGENYEVEDLLAGVSYQWKGKRNYVELNPVKMPAHIFHIRRRAPDTVPVK